MKKNFTAASRHAKKKQRPKTPARASAPVPPTSNAFPIVGLGASAGGLEALEQFLSQVPAQSGLAFVIVQHLDPTHVGIMPELLQRATAMKVMQVKDRTSVRPDCVYVIPPNKDLSILHGVLHLLELLVMRVMPYRTMDDRINGVVITFTDLTAAKVLEARLRAPLAGAESNP